MDQQQPAVGALDPENIFAFHVPNNLAGETVHARPRCFRDRQRWPCDAIQLAQALAAAEAQRARLEQQYELLLGTFQGYIEMRHGIMMSLHELKLELGLAPPSAAPQKGEHFGSHPDCEDNLACSCHASCPHQKPSATPSAPD
jgi:hypothetical protein